MTIDAELFTALTYGLLALVSILYLILLRAFWMDDREPHDGDRDPEEESAR